MEKTQITRTRALELLHLAESEYQHAMELVNRQMWAEAVSAQMVAADAIEQLDDYLAE